LIHYGAKVGAPSLVPGTLPGRDASTAVGRFLLATTAVAMTGCIHHPPYPDTWIPLRTSIGTDCSELSASFDYKSTGYSATGKGAPTLLWQLHWLAFGSRHDPIAWDPSRPTSVRLVIAVPQVTATFLAGTDVVRTLEIGAPATTVACDGRELQFRRIDADAAPMSPFAQSENAWLRLDEEGSLIVRVGSTSGGLGMLVVPVVDSHYEWIRYRRVRGEDLH
jgi:hypothetical protein